jgi:hypothetical protein
MGALPSLTATYPHAEGTIKVECKREGGGLKAAITLPGKLNGSFVYNGKEWTLKPGVNTIEAR